MNHETDHDNLLDDVLAESSPNGFRDAMLDDTLRLVSRRRRWKNARRSGAAFALIAIITAVLLQKSPNTTVTSSSKHRVESYTLIRTHPLPTMALLGTQPLSAEHRVDSSLVASVAIITSHGAVRIINDDELLALVAARPAMLVRLAPGLEQLVFVNPEDEKGFPLN